RSPISPVLAPTAPARTRTPDPLARVQARASSHPKPDMTTSRKKTASKSKPAAKGTKVARTAKAAKTVKVAKKSAARPAAVRRKAGGSDLLDPIFAAIRKLAGKGRQQDASLFAAAFYKRLTRDELPLHPPEAWAALAN